MPKSYPHGTSEMNKTVEGNKPEELTFLLFYTILSIVVSDFSYMDMLGIFDQGTLKLLSLTTTSYKVIR